MSFHVGQKVVCVDDRETNLIGLWREGFRPVKGKVYTVSATGLTHPFDPQELPCILVEELSRRVFEPIWAHRFRPIVSRKTDISIFTKMLKPVKQGEKL